MVVEDTPPPDLSALDNAALQDLVLSLHAQLQSQCTENEHLKLLILKLKRMQFGRKSEKLDKQIEQLELQLEDTEAEQAAAEPEAAQSEPAAAATAVPRKRTRRPLPENLRREQQRHEPKQEACPDCGGSLRVLARDGSQILAYVSATF